MTFNDILPNASTEPEEIIFFGTYVPWKEMKKFDSMAKILTKFKTGHPSFSADSLFIHIFDDFDKARPEEFKRDYTDMFRDMFGRIANLYGFSTFIVSEEKGQFKDSTSMVFYYGVSQHFNNKSVNIKNLPTDLIEFWKKDYMLNSFLTDFPFIKAKLDLHKVTIGPDFIEFGKA